MAIASSLAPCVAHHADAACGISPTSVSVLMGDQWLRDFEKAKTTALQLAKDAQSQGSNGHTHDARQAALLRGKQAQLRQEVSHLEQSLMAISQNTTAYNVTRKELSRRGDLLAQLSEQVEGIQEAVRACMRRRVDASEAPWKDHSSQSGRANGTRDNDDGDRDLLALGEQEIRNQDDTLDFLHGTVQNLKMMGSDISNEIDLHCQLLGDLADQTDSSTSKMRQAKRKLDSLSESNPTCYLWVYICVLIVALLVMVIFF